MISLQDLKRNYVKLYSEIKNYIWPFDTVEDLANLEIACFNRFPDIDEIRNLFRKLRSDMFSEIHEYDELKEAVENFQEFIDADEQIYSQLTSVTEEFTNESIEETKPRKESGKGRRDNRPSITVSRAAE